MNGILVRAGICCCLLLLLLIPTELTAQDSRVEEFLDAVETGSVQELQAVMHPKLVALIDEPILEAWLQAVAVRLGEVRDIQLKSELIAGQEEDRSEEYSAQVQFDKGIAEVEVRFVRNQVTQFKVTSDEMTNWFQRPTTLTIYQDQAEKFLQGLLTAEYATCQAVLHRKVAEQLTPTQLSRLGERIEDRTGLSATLAYQQAKLVIQKDDRLQEVELYYDLSGNQGNVPVLLTFRFQGMQGHLVGFRLLETQR